MRKVKVGAIQPKYLSAPAIYNCLSELYRKEPDEIVEHYVKKQLEVTLRLLEKAGEEGCDIVTTGEDIAGTWGYIADTANRGIFEKILELSAPLVEAGLSRISQKYSMYIVGCYNKRLDSKNFNIASIFDRSGNICAEYRKVHLPANEKWQVEEGDVLSVFELDFGKVGISICYDMMFQESIQVQALKGAEIIFHPTAGYGWYDSIGEATLRTRANDNSVYIVTAKNYVFSGAGKSSVIDFWGQVLADAGFYENVIVCKELDLDIKKTQPEWYNPTQTSGIADMTIRNHRERRPELYSIISKQLHERLDILDEERQTQVFQRIKSGECHW